MRRILVVLPMYGGSLPIGHYCARALEELGCLVDTFESPHFYSAFSSLAGLKVAAERLEFLENSFLQVVSQAILAKVESFQPDLVLCMAQAPLSRNALKRLRSDGIPTAMWFVEDYSLFTYWRSFAPYYDFFAVIQKEPFLSELKAIGVNNALYLPLAALPSLHTPRTLNAIEKKRYGADISFLGAGYPNRQKAFTRLTRYNFKIWGTEWTAPALQPYLQQGGTRITPEDAVLIYNATAINLNLHSCVNADKLVSHGDFVNPRTFELAACGAFQLTDVRGLMSELFTTEEIVQFTSMEELEEKIPYYLQHPEERAAIAILARERVLRDHTYAQRMEQLLSFITEHIHDFGHHADSSFVSSELPENVVQELAVLFQENKLPKTASFDDVIIAVRKKHGVLSDTETALLFLDEWKKLYMR